MNLELIVEKNLDTNKMTMDNFDLAQSLKLNGCAELYQSKNDDCYKDYVVNSLKNIISQEGSIQLTSENKINEVLLGEAIFFLYNVTGEEKYKKVLDSLSSNTKELETLEDIVDMLKKGKFNIFEYFYANMPFYMNYETLFNKKEGYIDIIAKFLELRNEYFQEDLQLYTEDTNSSVIDTKLTALHAMTLMDTIENASEEIYEHYKQLMVWFKESIKGILNYQNEDSKLIYEASDSKKVGILTSLMLVYAIKKACKYKVLLSEKYADMADEMLASILTMLNENYDDAELGLLIKIAAI